MPLLLLCLSLVLSIYLQHSNGKVSTETAAPRNLNAASYKLGFYSDGSCSVLLQSLHVESDFCQKGKLVCIGPYLLVENDGATNTSVSVTYHLATSESESAFELDYYSNVLCRGAPASHYNTGSTHESNRLFTLQCAMSYKYPTFEKVFLKWEQLPPDCAAYHGPIMSTTTTTTTTYPAQVLPGACGYEDSFTNPFVMIAGRFGSHGNSGDNDPAIGAQLNYPLDVALDPGEAPAPPPPVHPDNAKFPPYGAVVLPPGAQVTPLGRQVMSHGTVILPLAPEVMPLGLQEQPDGAIVLPPGGEAHPKPRVVMDPDWVKPPGPEVVTYGAMVMPPGPPGVSYGSVVMPPGTRVTPQGAEVISFGAVVKPPGVPEMPKWAQVLPQEAAVKPPGGPQAGDQRNLPFGHSVLPGAQPLPLAEVVPAGVPVVLPRPHDPRVKPPGWRKVYISDSANHAVRLVDLTNGTISTIAGRLARPGASRSSQERASSALLRHPHGLALDVSGHRLYVADYGNHVVRCIDLVKDTIGVVAGISEVSGHQGDGGTATAAQLSFPAGLAVDEQAQILYISDSGNHAIRRVDLSAGLMSTIAGTPGTYGKSGDGGLATSASLNTPRSISLDQAASKLYIADHGNHAVRSLDLVSGDIYTVAGVLGIIGGPGDGAAEGPAVDARLCYPTGLALDQAGAKLYIADGCNSALRRLDLTNGMLLTVSARPGFQGHLGDAGPAGLAFDPASRQIYTAEAWNHVVRVTDMDVQVGHHNPKCRPVRVM
mmetsp:Transcript_35654/g.66133  ORF Transcript_35654/g.66133 Transcript_35654/m.66133 type:complete len:765 (-) Transcript_35654:41-2335(-)